MAFAPGNVFLSGEHAVGWGFPAILGATSIGTVSIANKSMDGENSLLSDKYSKFARELKVPLRLVSGLSKGKTWKIQISSELPVEGGLSSSTAVLASIARALPEGKSLSKEALVQFLLPYQRKLHGGKCSGAEFASSIFGGFNRVVSGERGIEIKKIRAKPLRLLVTDTGVRAPTKKSFGKHMVSLVRRKRAVVFQSFRRIGEISDSVETALASQRGREEKLAVLFRENQSILKGLGVSHRRIEEISSIAKSADPLSGTKLSGGGMGGVALTSGSDLKGISRTLSARGFSPIEIIVGAPLGSPLGSKVSPRPNFGTRIK